jgi:creatinine amidohydrolase
VRARDLTWRQLEAYLERDDRIVLPLGSTEQHAYLSLETDNVLAERVSAEAAEPLGVPVLPALCYGVTPRFAAYPGSPSLSEETYVAVVSELLDALRAQGFGRILVVNGHGGNAFAAERVARPGLRWHDWWRAPRVWAVVQELDPGASHASWMESFPWTRVAGVELPEGRKEPPAEPLPTEPRAFREAAGDGCFGGRYRASEEDERRVWQTGVEETRALLEWG